LCRDLILGDYDLEGIGWISFTFTRIVLIKLTNRVLGLVLEMICAQLYPYRNGYCYTCAFPVKFRMSAASSFGEAPLLDDIVNHPLVDNTVTYEGNSVKGNQIHLSRVGKGGVSLKSLSTTYVNFHVGGQDFEMRSIETYRFVQPALRFLTWVLIFRMADWMMGTMVAAVMVVAYKLGLDFIGVGAAIIFSGVVIGSPLSGVFGGTMAGAMVRLMYSVLMKEILSSVRQMSPCPPSSGNYPSGRRPGQLNYNFTLHNTNSNYERAEYRDDSNLTSEERTAFMRSAGLSTTESTPSGNPHRMAAMISKFAKWSSERGRNNAMSSYKIAIGDCWKGWPCSVSGLALSPILTEGDGDRAINYPGRIYYGQDVIHEAIGTDTQPVGSNGEEFNPLWNITGLGGSDIHMVDVYDVPIKALLACASANNSDQVHVFMHASPSMFTDKFGELPWTGQSWITTDDNYVMTWNDTSGKIFVHNKRIIYEHFFTSYVCTRRSEWYVSEIPRQVLDGYLIRWTRQTVAPSFERHRQIVVPPRKDDVYIPLASRDPLTSSYKVKMKRTQIQLAEYVHKSKDIGELSVCLRAVIDNLYRNKGVDSLHFTPVEVRQTYVGESYRRKLEGIMDQPFIYGILALFGLAPDNGQMAAIAEMAFNCLVSQPPIRVTCEQLRQDNPYVIGNQTNDRVPERYYPLPCFGKPGDLVSQANLDTKLPLSVTKLKGEGTTMAEKLCYCLFGITTSIPHILPLGNPAYCGSQLENGGTQLLPTEFQHLILNNDILFCVKHNQDKRYYGGVNTEVRQVIVYLDFDDQKVSLIHRQNGIDTKRVMLILGMKPCTFTGGEAWLNDLNGTPRNYQLHPDAINLAVARREVKLTEKSMKTGNEGDHARNLLNDIDQWRARLNDFHQRQNDRVCNLNDSYSTVYDYHTRVDKFALAAHLYAAGTVENMKRLHEIQ